MSAKPQKQATLHAPQAQPKPATPPALPALPLDALQSVMPYYARESMRVFDDENEKAVSMLSTITALSALFPNVQGLYDRKRVRPNLYTLIIADAASGKGVMTYAEKLVLPIDNFLYESTPPQEEGKPLQERMLIIPANTSKARFLQHLRDNHQTALIIESEADTLKTALKSEHGGYTDILRQLFHHETVKKSMVKDGMMMRIINGALSVCLTGTPEQVGFIDNVENGLFSRFIYYTLPDKYEWRDVSPQGKTWCYDDHFNALAGLLLSDWQFFQSRASFEVPVMFDLTPSQWSKLNTAGRELTDLIKSLVEAKELRATGRRIMLIAYRIAMTLTAADELQGRKQTGKTLVCPDDFFEAAMTITDVCFDHAHAIASRMLNREHKGRVSDSAAKVVTLIEQAASPIFTRQQLLQIATAAGIKQSNFDNRILPQLVPQLLQKKGHGIYERTF